MHREQVLKAIDRTGPSYVPVYFVNRDQDQSDIVTIQVQHHFQGEGRDHSEWGFMWERLDETMGQPKSYLLQDDGDWSRLKPPDLNVPNRLRDVRVHSTLCRPFSHGIAGIERLYDDAVFARL